MNPSKALFKGAFILTIAAIITKILSAFYRIPFQNIVGDIGFYIYQQVYPFYGMAVVLSTTGFPVVISKLYAEQKENGEVEKSRLLLFVSFLYLQLFGLICFLVLYFGADLIARWMHDPDLSVLIRVVSIVFLTFPFMATLRGFYQGIGDMMPTALSQVGEQTVRVLTILFLSYLLMQKGVSLYLVGGGAMFGSITGTIVSGIILFMFIWIRKEWRIIAPGYGLLRKGRPWITPIVKALTFHGLAICISGMLMIFIQLADSLNLYSLLVKSGIGPDPAKTLKGIYDRGQPLIQLGTVVASSISLTLVPLITRDRMAARPEFLYHKIQLAIKVSLVIGLGAAFGLAAIINPTNIMLFENDLGSSVLGVLSFVILFTSIISIAMAVLQGLGSLMAPALATVSLFPVKYMLNMVLVPVYGTMGAAISTLISLGIVTIILLLKLKKMVPISLVPLRFLATVSVAALAMILSLKGYFLLIDNLAGSLAGSRTGAALQALSAVGFGVLVFSFIVIRGKVFREDELALFPFGSKFIYLMARKDRN
ncbi:polysaccharide biosynthesis protein [Bacillus sp. FJAT-29814]|uniref:putative polysaccharide biosynthesis protein n=1 Tax=Bacillus sp. FJAT-29814 TaxID=1729688 RepID=UPI000829A53C|nr:polysaccharide biosynthesis protein [Bacillus sp. FJAT-29814]